MIITYHGHSAFKLKGKRGTVITDPYDDSVGFAMPRLSADIVTVSHQHADHNSTDKVNSTARRENPFIVDQPGEYEVGGISVFGVQTFHDDSHGSERGTNIVFTILLDEIKVCHLGDLGHELTANQVDQIGSVDILLCPVGGFYTIDPAMAHKTIRALEPGMVIPMHYQTEDHNPEIFSQVQPLSNFIKEYGFDPKPVDKLDISSTQIPEETELVVMQQT